MLVKRFVVGKIEILEDGTLQLREDTVIEEDGVELIRTYHRRVLEPSLTPMPAQEHERLKNVASVVWTPEVVDEYERKKAKNTPSRAVNGAEIRDSKV